MQKFRRKIHLEHKVKQFPLPVVEKPVRPTKMSIDQACKYYSEVGAYRKYQYERFQAELKYQNALLTESRARTESEE